MATELKSMVYDGINSHLRGKTALVKVLPNTTHVLAQFDDVRLAEAFGWQSYPATVFREVPPAEDGA